MTQKQHSRAKTSSVDAIALLTEDHKKVQKLFQEFEKLSEADGDESKQALVKMICAELTIHATIEEEIFYPAARQALKEEDLLDEAEVEHATAKELVAQLETMQAGDDLYDAKVTVLNEYIEHHVKEEQTQLFPQVKKAKLDLEAVGEKMLERKQELQEEMGLIEEGDAEDDEEGEATTRPRTPVRAGKR